MTNSHVTEYQITKSHQYFTTSKPLQLQYSFKPNLSKQLSEQTVSFKLKESSYLRHAFSKMLVLRNTIVYGEISIHHPCLPCNMSTTNKASLPIPSIIFSIAFIQFTHYFDAGEHILETKLHVNERNVILTEHIILLQARLDILRIHSRKMNLTRGINLRKIAEVMPGASGAEVKVEREGVYY